MQTRHISIVLATVLALSICVPVAAAEKVAGVNKDFQRLSETTVPGQPAHTLKQIALLWKSISSNPTFGDAWVSANAQLDDMGNEAKVVSRHLHSCKAKLVR